MHTHCNTDSPLITACVATLPTRDSKRIISRLLGLPGRLSVLIDDRSDISIGKKRNEMLNEVSTKWVCFIDDDDDISDEYFNDVELAEKYGYDAVRQSTIFFLNGAYRLSHTNLMHYCPILTGLSKLIGYKDVRFGEDISHIIELCKMPLNIMNGKSEYKYYFSDVAKNYDGVKFPVLDAIDIESARRFIG